MTFGPYWNFPTETYKVDYYLRAPSPSGKMAKVDVYDSSIGAVLATRDVYDIDRSVEINGLGSR